LSARGRQKVLKLAAAAGYEIILVHMDTPLAICLERNSGRSRVVSDSTIKELSRSFIPAGLPRPSEGRIVRISSTRVDEATFEVET
jgi:predicted kinase